MFQEFAVSGSFWKARFIAGVFDSGFPSMGTGHNSKAV